MKKTSTIRWAGTAVFILAFSLILSLFPNARTNAQNGEFMEDTILKLINDYRKYEGLPALKMNMEICAAARKHSKDMATGRVPFGHSGFDERTDRLIKIFKPANAAAENVAYGAKTAEKVVDMWLNSPGHRKNIEGRYNLTGIGIARDEDGTLYFTQIFINKQPAQANNRAGAKSYPTQKFHE